MDHPDESAEFLLGEATGDIALGDLEAAEEKLRRCIEAAPLFFDGWHALAMVSMKLGNFQAAIKAGLRAVDLRPEDQLAWSSLSLFYVRNGQIPEAEAAGAKARVLGWKSQLSKPQVFQDLPNPDSPPQRT